MSNMPECKRCGGYVYHGPVLCDVCVSKAETQLAEARAKAAQMIELLREYRREHDADACSPNGNPSTCKCSMCRKLAAILLRSIVGQET
jgi:uncharacterized Zn finger protein (UPF0148 family)